MINITVRKQGREAFIIIPPKVLEMLNIEVGSKLDFDVSDGILTIRPAAKSRGYSIAELLQGQVGAAC